MSSDGKIQSACSNGDYIYYSYDYGVNWARTNSISTYWTSIAMSSDGKIQSSCSNGDYIYYSYATTNGRGDTYLGGRLDVGVVEAGGTSNYLILDGTRIKQTTVYPGTSGTSGITGVAGTSGTSGSGVAGTSGTSGSGVAGTSGTSGSGSSDRSFTWVVANPSSGKYGSNILGPRLSSAATPSSVWSYTQFNTSVAFDIYYGNIGSTTSILSSPPIISLTGGTSTTSFSTSTVTAGSWLILNVSAVDGTPGQVVVTLSMV